MGAPGSSDAVDGRLAQWATVRPDLDVSAMGVLGRLSRLTRISERALQTLFGRHGLQPGEFDILATLRRADPARHGLTAGRLADQAMRTSGAITNRLDRLVAKSLVTRVVDPENRRTVLVALTDEGLAILDDALVEHVANEEDFLAALTTAERDTLATLLKKLLVEHGDVPVSESGS